MTCNLLGETPNCKMVTESLERKKIMKNKKIDPDLHFLKQ